MNLSNVVWQVNSHSIAETWLIAAKLAQYLRAGDVIGLDGELGSGKTHFVQGVLGALGVDPANVTSPTFTLIQEYDTNPPVCHLDAYRLRDIDEFLELGVDELLGGDVVCLIEWASRVREVLPQDMLQLDLNAVGPEVRTLTFSATGRRSVELLQSIQAE